MARQPASRVATHVYSGEQTPLSLSSPAILSRQLHILKIAITILLSCLVICGCSQKQPTSARPAIDLVEAGKDISWRDGYILHVDKRDGAFLEGIQISRETPEGQKVILTAETGTVSPRNEGVVNMILTNAIIHTGTESRTDTVYMTALSK